MVLSIAASQQQRVVNDRSCKCDASCKSVCGGSVEGRAKKATSREREREEKVRAGWRRATRRTAQVNDPLKKVKKKKTVKFNKLS